MICLGAFGCSAAEGPDTSFTSPSMARAPESVILLVADGAGVAHWSLAAFADEDLSVRRMTTVGLVDTRGADHVVSGSAPTATAYATGVRSRMGYVGVGPDGERVPTVVEVAMERGMSTGLLTTTGIVDATPAAFGAHSTSRYAFGEIARDMATKGITVLMGGGRGAFRPASQPDGRDLLAELQDDYTYVEDISALRSLDPDTVDALLGLFAEGEMGVVGERGDALGAMTETALDILARDADGFFLLIENEESDTQSHRNAPAEIITREMLDFARSVRIALNHQREHPETLVIVTSDHETGGISLPHDESRDIVMTYATGGHTGELVPLFAAGPGAERLGGIIGNEEVGRILLEFVRDP